MCKKTKDAIILLADVDITFVMHAVARILIATAPDSPATIRFRQSYLNVLAIDNFILILIS
jgi:hypothetical protein